MRKETEVVVLVVDLSCKIRPAGWGCFLRLSIHHFEVAAVVSGISALDVAGFPRKESTVGGSRNPGQAIRPKGNTFWFPGTSTRFSGIAPSRNTMIQ